MVTADATIDTFWETIPPVWNSIRGNVRAVASEHFGVSVEQFHILRHIRKGTSSVSDLADVRQISRPAISQAVEVLVTKGLVARAQEARDRRCVRLALTRSGDRLLTAIFDKNRAWMKARMASLSDDDHRIIHDGLALLRATFDEGTACRPQNPRSTAAPNPRSAAAGTALVP